MRKYLETLHTRSEKHKKRFALVTSLSITLSIFALWSFVNFGQGVVATQPKDARDSDLASEERVSPFKFVGGALAASFSALGERFGEAKKGLEAVDVEGEYEDVRDEALGNYDY